MWLDENGRAKGKDVHIPYRNSLLTQVLRDSLGGNSKTVMIATISPSQEHVEESISTCRFALRVASVRQNAVINEELDPNLLIRRLRKEVADLKEELQFYRTQSEDSGAMLEADKRRCVELCREYVADSSSESALNVGKMSWVRECFRLLKSAVMDGGAALGLALGAGRPARAFDAASAPSSPAVSPVKSKQSQAQSQSQQFDQRAADIVSAVIGDSGAPGSAGLASDKDQIRKLQLQVQQRDNEISAF